MEDKDIIRSKIDIFDLVSETVTLKRAGANYKGLCPFHNERTPSFMVNPEIGIFKCFGCGESGDIYDWMIKTEGMTFPEALQALADRAGVTLKSFKPSEKDNTRQRHLQILDDVANFYHHLLIKHPAGQAARDYIRQRGITMDAVQTFRLGYAPSAWDGLIQYARSQKYTFDDLHSLGLIVRKSPQRQFDMFRDRLMFPLSNHRGQVLGFAGRILTKDARGPKYINTRETPLYHKGELLYALDITKTPIRQSKTVIITEGELDTISSWQAGVQNVVALKGTALTADQINLLKRYADTVILALDMDVAGDKAAHKGIQLAEAAGLEVRVIQMPEGKDPDDIARTDIKAWQALADQAVDVYQYCLDSAISRYDLRSAQGKRHIVEELTPIWAGITNEILRAHWVGELARTVQVDQSLILKQLKSPKTSPRSTNTLTTQPSDSLTNRSSHPPTTRRKQLETQLAGLLLQSSPTDILDPSYADIWQLTCLTQLIDWLPQHQTDDWQSQVPEHLRTNLANALMLSSRLSGVRAPQASQLANQIRQLDNRHTWTKLSQQLRVLKEGTPEHYDILQQINQLNKAYADLRKRS